MVDPNVHLSARCILQHPSCHRDSLSFRRSPETRGPAVNAGVWLCIGSVGLEVVRVKELKLDLER